MPLVIINSTTLVLGAQILYGSILLYLLESHPPASKGASTRASITVTLNPPILDD